MADPTAIERDKRQPMAQQMLGLADDEEYVNLTDLPEPANDVRLGKPLRMLQLWKKGHAAHKRAAQQRAAAQRAAQQRAAAPQRGTQPALAEGGPSQRLAGTESKSQRLAGTESKKSLFWWCAPADICSLAFKPTTEPLTVGLAPGRAGSPGSPPSSFDRAGSRGPPVFWCGASLCFLFSAPSLPPDDLEQSDEESDDETEPMSGPIWRLI
jgi:hypothetical protein